RWRRAADVVVERDCQSIGQLNHPIESRDSCPLFPFLERTERHPCPPGQLGLRQTACQSRPCELLTHHLRPFRRWPASSHGIPSLVTNREGKVTCRAQNEYTHIAGFRQRAYTAKCVQRTNEMGRRVCQTPGPWRTPE